MIQRLDKIHMGMAQICINKTNNEQWVVVR